MINEPPLILVPPLALVIQKLFKKYLCITSLYGMGFASELQSRTMDSFIMVKELQRLASSFRYYFYIQQKQNINPLHIKKQNLIYFYFPSPAPRRALPSDIREHKPACAVVEPAADGRARGHRLLADEASQELLRGQETCVEERELCFSLDVWLYGF